MLESSMTPAPVGNALEDVQIDVSICLGHMQVRMDDLSRLSVDEVLNMGASLEDPILLYVGKRLIAKGVLEETPNGASGSLGIRIMQVLTSNEA